MVEIQVGAIQLALSALGVLGGIVAGVCRINATLNEINKNLVRLEVGKVSYVDCHNRREELRRAK